MDQVLESYVNKFFINSLRFIQPNPNDFVELLLDVLSEVLPLKAVSFYSFERSCEVLVLRKQNGLDYDLYESFERYDKDSFPPQAVKNQRIILIRDVAQLRTYQEGRLANDFGLHGMLAVQLFSRDGQIDEIPYPDDNPPIKIGVIFAYVKNGIDLDQMQQIFFQIEPFISAAYVSSLMRDKHTLRRQMVKHAMLSRDINSFLFRTIHYVSTQLGIEAASVFLWSDRSKLLRLHATTGLDIDGRKSDTYYRQDEDMRSVKVALTGKPLVTSTKTISKGSKGKFNEKVKDGTKSFIFLPIPDWTLGKPLETRPLGLLRAVNKLANFGEKTATIVSFAWDDVVRLRFVSELMGVVAVLMRKAEQRVEDFDKILHGAKSNIEAVILNLGLFESRPSLITINDASVDYIIPNSISHMLDVKHQIERIEAQDKEFDANIGEVKIMGEVLAPLIDLIKKMAISLNVKRVDCTNLKQSNFQSLPTVLGNVEAFMTVFRNLAENALKYSDPRKPKCKIDLGYRIEEEMLSISITDNGIGIPAGLDEWIFVEGFRAENAIRRVPAGGGIGLSQSKRIMGQMGGTLVCNRLDDGTMFIVKMKLYKTGGEQQ